MAKTDDVQRKVTNSNNSSADNFPVNLQKNSVTGSVTNRINNNDPIESATSPQVSPLMRYFDFDESNYSYVLGYN